MNVRALALSCALVLAASAAQASCALPTDADAYANQLAQGLNAQRSAAGLRPLAYNGQLSQAAMRHACDMQANGFFDHRGSDGTNSHQRVTSVGYRSCLTAENLAFGYPQAMTVVNGWMNSPGHRQNMMHHNATEFGIGLAAGRNGPIAVLVLARRCGA